MMRRTLGAIALCLVLASCGGGPTPLNEYAIPGEGIWLSVPPTWRAIDYRQARSFKFAKRFVRGDPDFYPAITALTSRRSPLKFVAIDPRVHFRTRDDVAIRASVNVVVTPASAGLSFGQYRKTLVRQLRRQLGKDADIADEVIDLDGDRAVRIRVAHRRQVGSVTLTVKDTQYALLRPRRSIVITYEIVKELEARYTDVFEASAASIRIR